MREAGATGSDRSLDYPTDSDVEINSLRGHVRSVQLYEQAGFARCRIKKCQFFEMVGSRMRCHHDGMQQKSVSDALA